MPVEMGTNFYTFEPYNYGPFSKQVYVDADELQAEGLVARVAHQGGDWEDYAATQEGVKKAGELSKNISQKAVQYLQNLVKWSAQQSFPDLVRWVYANYPSYKANSLFVD